MKNTTKRTPTKAAGKAVEEAEFGNPIPTRFDQAEEAMIRSLAKQLHIPRSEIIKRACKYALPKFASGELPLVTMPAAAEQLQLA